MRTLCIYIPSRTEISSAASAMLCPIVGEGCCLTDVNRYLLTPKGWTLSPAYDLNPTLNEYQALLINSTTNHADLHVLLDSSEEYMIGKEEAGHIIDEVKSGVKYWKSIANRLGIAKREMDVFEQVYQRTLK